MAAETTQAPPPSVEHPEAKPLEVPAAQAKAVEVEVTEPKDVEVAVEENPKEVEVEVEVDSKKEEAVKEKDVKVAEEPVDPEKKALDELKQLLAAAIANREFSKKKEKTEEHKKEEAKAVEPKEEEKPEEPKKEETVKAEEEKGKGKAPEEPEEPTKSEETHKEVEEAKKEEESKVEEKQEVPKAEEVQEEEPKKEEEEAPEEVALWGVPLLDGGELSDTILLKFLRARELKVKDALSMIKGAVEWRKEFGADGLLTEDLGLAELEKAVFMHGVDREGHPVCYNVYGQLEDKELFQKALGDEEKRKKFLRWRVQLLEKGIKLLDFRAGGISSMVQVNDLKGSRWLWKKEIRQATWHAIDVLQDNYPEFVASQVFINVPWWYLAYNRMVSPFINQRTKSKFIFAGPSRSAEILFKYVAPEQVPVKFGGLSNDNDPDFSRLDKVTDVTIKPSSKSTVEIPVSESGGVLVWELRVLGWDISYGAEFVPEAKDGYTVIIQKTRKIAHTDDPVEKNSYKIGEPGKIVLNFDNIVSKKKKLLYRYKIKSSHGSI